MQLSSIKQPLKAVRAHLRDQRLLHGCHRRIVRPWLLLLHARPPTAWVQWRRPPCRTAHLLPQVLLRLPMNLLQVRRGERRLLRLRLRGKLRLVRREVRLLLLLLLGVLLLRLRLRLLLLVLREGQLLLRRQRRLLRLVLRVAVMLRCLRILVRMALLRCRWLGAPLGPCRPGCLARSRLRVPSLAGRLLTAAWARRLLGYALRLGLRCGRRGLARLQLFTKAVQALRDLHDVVILPAHAARPLSTTNPCRQHWRAQQERFWGPSAQITFSALRQNTG